MLGLPRRYRPNVAVIVTDGKGKVLLCTRVYPAGFIQTVQGGIDQGETPRQAAERELTEELGVNRRQFKILATSKEKHRYEWTMSYLKRLLRPRYIGQEQQYFLAKIPADTNFVLDAYHPEFTSVRWGTPEELAKRIWRPKRKGMRSALHEFGLLSAARGKSRHRKVARRQAKA